ncbi:MAG: extracellular solute-binding protein [Oscillospiraceae bacterium]|nr:extracellular solute-binding protein [Oscillospiraceae bacterium]
MRFKKILAAVMSAVMVLAMSSCGKGGEGQVPQNVKTTDDGKKIVTVYALYMDDDLKNDVSDFNRKSSEYQAEVKEYGKDYPDDPITRLNNDIIAGKIPDVILLHPAMPIDSYISKGFLADLYGLMDKDEAFSRTDYLDGVLKAYETNGKLYELVPSFSINTLVGKASITGSTSGWTVDEFIKLADENPDKYIVGDRYCVTIDRSNFFSAVTRQCYENFIDRESGKCNFDSEDFIRLMEFTDRFPQEVDREQMEANSNNYWTDYYKACRDGDMLLCMCSIGNFEDMRILEKVNYVSPVTFKGYPGAKGNGAVFNAYKELAAAENASNPEGAWEFLKYFLTDEYQEQYAKNDSDRFPLKLSAVEKAAEAAKEMPYYEDDNGRKVYEQKTYWNGSAEVNIGINTDEENKNIINFINSVENISRYDSGINAIISEEAATYFSGQKSSKEAAEIIQNRVQNYIDESR